MQFVLRDTGCAEYSMKHHVRTILAILKLVHGGSAHHFPSFIRNSISKAGALSSIAFQVPTMDSLVRPGLAVQIPELWRYQSLVNPQESVC